MVGKGKGRGKKGRGCLASGYDETATSKMVGIKRREKRGGRKDTAKKEAVWQTREKKARYTCSKERRDTYSTVTKHPSFGRESKERKWGWEGTRGRIWRTKFRGRDDGTGEERRASGMRWGLVGCMRAYGSKIFPFLRFLLPLGFLFRDFLSTGHACGRKLFEERRWSLDALYSGARRLYVYLMY